MTIKTTHARTCDDCGRQRTDGTGDHPMDATDYSPFQVVAGHRLGWYSADDAEVCPEDMEKMIRGAR